MPQMGPIIWPMFPMVVAILLVLFFIKVDEEIKVGGYSSVKNMNEKTLIW